MVNRTLSWSGSITNHDQVTKSYLVALYIRRYMQGEGAPAFHRVPDKGTYMQFGNLPPGATSPTITLGYNFTGVKQGEVLDLYMGLQGIDPVTPVLERSETMHWVEGVSSDPVKAPIKKINSPVQNFPVTKKLARAHGIQVRQDDPLAIDGTDLKFIDRIIQEHAVPEQPLDLYIGVQKELSDQELNTIQAKLAQGGVHAQVDFGSTSEWPNALRLHADQATDFNAKYQWEGYIGGAPGQEYGIQKEPVAPFDDVLRGIPGNPLFSKEAHPKILPLPVLLVGALGAVGIVGILGYKLSQTIDKTTTNITKNIVPLALIAGGVVAVVVLAGQKRGA